MKKIFVAMAVLATALLSSCAGKETVNNQLIQLSLGAGSFPCLGL